MIYTIFLEDTFDSAHWLPNVPAGHKCKRMHGHTYSVRIEVSGTLGKESGWVIDYADIKSAWQLLKEQLDHQTLNHIPGLENSTCEMLCGWLHKRLSATLPISAVEIRETAHCGCRLEAYAQ